MHVRESIRLEVPLADVYRFWRRLENLPRFMTHLDRVTESLGRPVALGGRGPAGLAVEWDAEIINEVENKVIAWRSLPGSDVVTAGSVNFDAARGGRSTQVSVHLQYAPPAGKAGALIASLFGREPSQTIREDLAALQAAARSRRDSPSDGDSVGASHASRLLGRQRERSGSRPFPIRSSSIRATPSSR